MSHLVVKKKSIFSIGKFLIWPFLIVVTMLLLHLCGMRPAIDIQSLDFNLVSLPEKLSCSWQEVKYNWAFQTIEDYDWFDYYVGNSEADIKALQTNGVI